MALTRGEKLGGSIVFLLETGGAGIAIAFPQFQPLGFILIGIGLVPITWWLVEAGWHLAFAANPHEKKRAQQALQYRRDLIANSREMISRLVKEDSGILVVGSPRDSFQHKLRIESAYLAIAPYMSDKFKKDMNMGSNHVFVVVGGSMPYEASAFMRELDRLEIEWGVGA